MSYNVTKTDPLALGVSDRARELFKHMSKLCVGFNLPDAADAGFNVVCNAVRQGSPSRKLAEATFDELVGKMKTSLLEGYDPVTGKRKSVFAWDQGVELPFIVDRDIKH